ncbi:MAG: hypothetical protein Q8P18_21585 [Pseudomonadota bacterium]|nr:hypothetical protein [Pseudomonadota bacterium]
MRVTHFRQDDKRWRGEVMWNRALVAAAAAAGGVVPEDAADLMPPHSRGNATIGSDGCMITSLAMILRWLDPDAEQAWNPQSVLAAAVSEGFSHPSGISMVTLYADLVSDVSKGEVQLACKEDYLSGRDGWGRRGRNFVADCALLQAYLRLPPTTRADFAVMLKIGTWSDAFASHFVVVHPGQEGVAHTAEELRVLDPAMSETANHATWTLADADRNLRHDPKIGEAWRDQGIEPGQLAGVWMFARWRQGGRYLLGALLGAMASEV